MVSFILEIHKERDQQMDRPNSSLIQFDSILLDVNENPSNIDSDDKVQSESTATSDKSLKESNNSVADVFSPSISPKVLVSEIEFETLEVSDSLLNAVPIRRKSGIRESKISLDGDNCSANDILGTSQDDGQASVETEKLFDITGCNLNISNGFGSVPSEFSKDVYTTGEVFHDAVQFFKDPSSFTFLENAGGSTTTENFNHRSSLFMNFDPLHANSGSKTPKQPTVLEEISESDLYQEVPGDASDTNYEQIHHKHIAVEPSYRGSFGNILISFDSPSICNNSGINASSFKTEMSVKNENPKLYTEDDLQQTLKIQELSLQEQFIKKQKEMENKITKQNDLCSSLFETLSDFAEIAYTLSEKEKSQLENIEQLTKENEKLKEDLKTSIEDLQSVENTFADFHKRYEQCKSMLKVYTQNEGSLKQQIENLSIKLQEKEEMYNALQVRTQEMVDKANLEVANVKKAGDAQTAVLKAQLKKAELKISSLESDVKHIKIENGKLSSICDELMAKVSET